MTSLISNELSIGKHKLIWGARTYVMGIINVTPDSFSGDGLLTLQAQNISETNFVERALMQARHFVDLGVDILDIGGESTRPGAQPATLEQELARVIPSIRAITQELDVLVSVDTYKAQVAEAALQCGAQIVNDIWGLHADSELAGVAAKNHAPVILMHNRSSWVHAEIREKLGGRYVGIPYDDLIMDICNELMESVEIAHQAGIPDEQIILDPGVGFGKTVEQNLELVDRLPEIRALGYPILCGTSRKSFIGYTLNLPPDQRLEGSLAAAAVSIVRGADIIRVHDVEQTVRVARMTDAIIRR
ncbi:MAG: dihydropteroate synthase [Chloroflexi bacterium]|nr:dihydropteroate synthase [Chloroflexota bacterium]